MYLLGVLLLAVAVSSVPLTPTVQTKPAERPQIEERPQGQPQNLIGTLPEDVQAEPEPLPYEFDDEPQKVVPPQYTRPLPRPSQSARGSSTFNNEQFTKRDLNEVINLQPLLYQSKNETINFVPSVLAVPLGHTKVLFLLTNSTAVSSTREPNIIPNPTLVNRTNQDINTSSGRKYNEVNDNEIYISPFDPYGYDEEQENVANRIFEKIYNNYPNDVNSYADANHSDITQSFNESNLNISNSEIESDQSKFNHSNISQPSIKTNFYERTFNNDSIDQTNFNQPTFDTKLKFNIPTGQHTFIFDSGKLHYNHTEETKPIYFRQPSFGIVNRPVVNSENVSQPIYSTNHSIVNVTFSKPNFFTIKSNQIDGSHANSSQSIYNTNHSTSEVNFNRTNFFTIKSNQNDSYHANSSQPIYTTNHSTSEINFRRPNFFTIKSIQYDGHVANASQPIYNIDLQHTKFGLTRLNQNLNNGSVNNNNNTFISPIKETLLNQTNSYKFEKNSEVVTNPPYTHQLYFKPQLLSPGQIHEKLYESIDELFDNDTLIEMPYNETLNVSSGEQGSQFEGYSLNESYVNNEDTTELPVNQIYLQQLVHEFNQYQKTEKVYNKNSLQDLYVNKIIDDHIKAIQDKLEKNSTINNSTIFQVITFNPLYGIDLEGKFSQNESNVTTELFANLFNDIENNFLNLSEESAKNLTQNALNLFKFHIQDLISNGTTQFNKSLSNLDENFTERKLAQNLSDEELNQVYNSIASLEENILNLNDDFKSIFRNSVINQFPKMNEKNISVQVPENENIENYLDEIYLQRLLNALNNLNSNNNSYQQDNRDNEGKLTANQLSIRQLYNENLIHKYLSSLGNKTINNSTNTNKNSLNNQINNDYNNLDFPSYRGFSNRVDNYTSEYYGDLHLTEFDPNFYTEDRSFGSPNKEIPENLKNYFAEQLYVQKLIRDYNQSRGNESYKNFLEKVYNISFIDLNSITNYTLGESTLGNLGNETLFKDYDFNTLSNISTYSQTISPLEQALYQLYALKFIFEYKLLENNGHNPYFAENDESNYNTTITEKNQPFGHFGYAELGDNNMKTVSENIKTTEITGPASIENTRHRDNIELTKTENIELTIANKTRPYIYKPTGYTNSTNFSEHSDATDIIKYPENIKNDENSSIIYSNKDTKGNLDNDKSNTNYRNNNSEIDTTNIDISNNSENSKENSNQNNSINKNITKITKFNRSKINFLQNSLKTINSSIDSLTHDADFSARNFGQSSLSPDFENLEDLQKLFVLLQTKKTNFDCLERPSGFYADLDFSCKVFHRCVDGDKFTFVCSPGTLFNQELLTCDFSFKVDCKNSPQYYNAVQTQ